MQDGKDAIRRECVLKKECPFLLKEQEYPNIRL